MTLEVLALLIFGFLCGSIPFAVFITQYGLNVDVRDFGDGNPGAFNVMRAGGLLWGGVAIFLDIGKGALPVGLAAYIIDITGWPLVLICLAPPLGHAFSPFLHFHGGKAIATSGGVLIGLSLVELPIVAIIMLVYWYTSLTSSGWAVMFTVASVLAYIILTGANFTWFMAVFGLGILLASRHNAELRHMPYPKMSPFLRPILKRLFSSTEITSDSADPVHNNRPDHY